MNISSSASKAVELGLIRFAPPGNPYPGRRGNQKHYVIDSRGAGSNLALRHVIVSGLKKELRKIATYDMVGGIAKSGTTWGCLLAWEQKVPFANVLLDGPRASGLQREIEGEVKGKNVVLVDNWIRTGESVEKAIAKVEVAGGKVTGIIVIVKLQVVPLISSKQTIPISSVWTLPTLIDSAITMGLVDESARNWD